MKDEKNEESEEVEVIKINEVEKDEAKPIEISSAVFSDGTIVEMVYDKKVGSTALAVYDQHRQVEMKQAHEFQGTVYKPHSPKKGLVNSGVILFPSEVKECGSQKELVQELQKFIHKYLSVSPFFEKISSYYVLFSWLYDDFNEVPYLRGLGDYGTGKSRFLQVVGSICYTPIFASGATTVSPIFRILDEFKGTLVFDEADLRFSDTTADMVKILNSGFMKGMPVIRSEANGKKGFDVKPFKVFGPKIIATRQLFKDTALESRMITEDMNLNSLGKDVPYNIPDEFWEEALELRNKLLMFRFRYKGTSRLKPELENRAIEARLNQIALPLMSIVEDQDLVSEIQAHIKEYNEKIKTDRTLNYNYQILDAICWLLDEGYHKPTMQQIADRFNQGLSMNESITAKKMGYLVNKTLYLKTARTRDGFVLCEDNAGKIALLRKRYGIDKNETDVNDVNNTSTLGDEYKDIPIIKDCPF